MINKIYAVWIYVKDLEESTNFYKKFLELKVKFKQKNWTEFDLGDTSFALLKKSKDKNQEVKPQKTRIMFEVDDLNQAKKRIELGGIKIINIREEEYGKLLTFEDPNGHWLELFEPKEKVNLNP